jgi:integrase
VNLAVVEATLPHLPPVTADMVRFQLLTGARPGEVCSLTPGAVDRSGDVWEYRVEGHKTEHHGRTRVVYIGPEAQAVLRPYLLRQSDMVCFSMAESLEQRRQARSEQRVTPLHYGNRRGKRNESDRPGWKRTRTPQVKFDPSSYRHAIHHACDPAFPAPPPLARREGESDQARLRRLTDQQREELNQWQQAHRWHPNQLRHTRATEIRRKFGLEAAQVILGHAAADVTQVYAERDAEKAREVARLIG